MELVHSFVCAASLPAAALVMYSRVYLGYHNTYQVLAGGIIGSVSGVVWTLLTGLLEPVFPGMAYGFSFPTETVKWWYAFALCTLFTFCCFDICYAFVRGQ